MRALVLAALAAASAAAGAAPPALGRYAGQLCVATGAAVAPSCGAAEIELRSRARVNVRVADIEYRLALRSSQLDVTTHQGTMQLDEFSSEYAWAGEVLRFSDADKGVNYEVRLGTKRTAGR